MHLTLFCVDGLVGSHNSAETVVSLCRKAVKTGREGSFTLGSCGSDSEVVGTHMKEDGNFVDHASTHDKVLGYPQSDIIQPSQISSRAPATTKRGILSQNSSVFYPLSLCLPGTIKGKILLSDLWKQEFPWEEKIPPDIQEDRNKFFLDLAPLYRIKFPRFMLDESVPVKLIIFCNASQPAFGFAACVWQRGCAKLNFAKAKVVPLVKKTLPTLELLSVFLAFKCVPNMLRALPDSSISDIVVAVDAQVALSWLHCVGS